MPSSKAQVWFLMTSFYLRVAMGVYAKGVYLTLSESTLESPGPRLFHELMDRSRCVSFARWYLVSWCRRVVLKSLIHAALLRFFATMCTEEDEDDNDIDLDLHERVEGHIGDTVPDVALEDAAVAKPLEGD
eukprot:6491239-Amphidinium_carterae.2